MSSNIEENKKEESEEEETMLQEKSEDKTESHQESDEGKESDEESESKVDNPSILEKDNTIVELQLGDIIHITSPLNETLNDQLFSIEYIDSSKIELINTDTLNKIRLTISKDGFLGDGTIERIAIRSRLDTPSYARQNGLLPGKWINIYFGGEFPIIITGEITNLEKDMIEIIIY
jgi:hypothetical protein